MVEVLATTRKKLGITQQKLSELADVSLPTIQNIESGKANPSLDILEKITGILGLKISIETKATDWNKLTELGLPLSSNIKKSKTKPTKNVLIHELRKAIISASNIGASREIEALAATFLAIKTHWPSVYKSLNSLQYEADSLIGRQDLARIIKLRRLAIDRLKYYL